MARLTLAEKRLLRYPPTATTWECLGTTEVIRQDVPVKVRCGAINSGSSSKCVFCGKSKPKRPKLVWPSYAVACKKAGIEPGTRWRESDQPTPTPARQRKGRK